MELLSWIFFGALIGWISNLLVKGKGRGCFGNALIGIIGSVIGGFIFNFFGKRGVIGFDLESIIVGVIGSIVLLILINLAGGNKH